MTLPKKGTRAVDVGGVTYRWHVRRKPTYAQAIEIGPMCVAIEQAGDGPRCVLVVALGVTRPDNWIDPHQTALKPAEVKVIISRALTAGWEPERAGPPFEFDHGLIRDRP